jgi:hypothetical protein
MDAMPWHSNRMAMACDASIRIEWPWHDMLTSHVMAMPWHSKACTSVERSKFSKLVAFGFFAFWSRIVAFCHGTLLKCPLHIVLTLDVITLFLATVFNNDVGVAMVNFVKKSIFFDFPKRMRLPLRLLQLWPPENLRAGSSCYCLQVCY